MSQTPNEERKTLILTGASRGIGHATVKRFSSAGWRVITCSRHGFPEDCPWEAGPEDHIQVDLSDPDDTMRAIAVMKERLKAQGGRLTALVNNAAISPKGEGGARLGRAHPGHGRRLRPARSSRQRHLAWRDRHCDPVAWNGDTDRRYPDAPARAA